MPLKPMHLTAALAAVALGLPAGAAAQSVPPHPYFSLDPLSASLSPVETPGDVFESPKSLSLSHVGLGLAATDDVDALSIGKDPFDPTDPCPMLPVGPDSYASNIYWWSIDRASEGAPGGGSVASVPPPCVSGGHPELDEAAKDDAAADVFMQIFDLANPKIRLNFLQRDEAPIGLAGANADEIDALETTDPVAQATDHAGKPVAAQDTYFSLKDSADILRVDAATSTPYVLWPAASLGLTAHDDVDALCVNPMGDPATLLISLDRGSPSLGTTYSPADVFKVVPGSDPFPGSGIQVPFLPARFLSLLETDNLDGLDCSIGDPGSNHVPPPEDPGTPPPPPPPPPPVGGPGYPTRPVPPAQPQPGQPPAGQGGQPQPQPKPTRRRCVKWRTKRVRVRNRFRIRVIKGRRVRVPRYRVVRRCVRWA